LGVQSGRLQLHTDGSASDIIFGYGSSTSFFENMRIKGNGYVGIGTSTPATRLDVASLSNWDLVNTEGDMRIGTSSYRLQFGIALGGGGVGAAGIMQAGGINLLSLGSNGGYQLQLDGSNNAVNISNSASLRLNGNPGAAGQVIQSNGAGAPTWASSTNTLFNNTVDISPTSTVTTSSTTPVLIPGMTYSFSSNGTSKIAMMFSINITTNSCTFCGNSSVYLDIYIDGGYVNRWRSDVANGILFTLSGVQMATVGGGNHTIELKGFSIGPSVTFGTHSGNNMIIQVIPQ